MATVREIYQYLDGLAPFSLQMEFDNAGFLVGREMCIRDRPARLRQIADDMDLLLAQFQPQAMAVEELFFNNNITTGIGVAQARGVLLLAAERRGVPIFEYTPSQVKQAVVGYGKAEKRQVMDMTRRLLNLSAVPKPDDAADAVAIALCLSLIHI